MSYNIDDTLRAIRKDCRLAMNGVVSTSMREYGLDYKLNFGLVNQQIRGLADKYGPSAELADRLWHEQTRELKILATLVYPVEEFSERIANEWIKNIPNQEIREQACFNLFQHLPYANDIASQWVKNTEAEIRTTGYWLLARLFLSKKTEDNFNTTHLDQYVWEDIIADDTFLRKSSISVLKYLIRRSREEAQFIIDKVQPYNEVKEDKLKQQAYQELVFEYEFIYK